MAVPRRVAALALAAMALLGPTAGALALADAPASPPGAPGGGEDSVTGAHPPDPETDVLGWEAGYWANESVEVTTDDGLNDTELSALTARAMARVEVLRGLEFHEPVPVEVVARSNLTAGAPSFWADTPSRTDGVWEALWILGEDTDAVAEIGTHYDEGALGYYVPARDRILLIGEDGTAAGIAERTLVHELVHALQDQHFDLTDPRYDRERVDGYLAANALVEGEAVLVAREFAARCGGEWSCVEGSGGGVTSANFAMKTTLFFPYGDGPAYVYALRERGGWAAVNAAHRDLPTTASGVIHPNGSAGATRAAEVVLPARAREPWTLAPGGRTSVGEVGVFMLFWAQSHRQNLDVVATQKLYRPDEPVDRWAFEANVSVGWRGDALLVYRHGETGELAYVWRLRFASEDDAREFLAAYRTVLDAHGARAVDADGATRTATADQATAATATGGTDVAAADATGTWVVPDGPYADAFRLSRTGRTVTVVNAPTVAALEAVHPAGSPTPSPVETTTAHTPTLTPSTTEPADGTEVPPTGTVPPGRSVGVGDVLLGAVLGIGLVLAWLAMRRRRGRGTG